jgi:hypothetical protein
MDEGDRVMEKHVTYSHQLFVLMSYLIGRNYDLALYRLSVKKRYQPLLKGYFRQKLFSTIGLCDEKKAQD